MWQLPTPFPKRIAARHTPASRLRRYRPQCKILEDRCLLSVSLSYNTTPVPTVGNPITWVASSSGYGATPIYQFSVGPVGGALHVVQDFSTSNSFVLNPIQQMSYHVLVIAEAGFGDSTQGSAGTFLTVNSRVVGSSATVSPTSNPLVALYSAPPSPGSSIYVQFAPLSAQPIWTDTTPLPIVPGTSTNFIVAGMLPNTTYLMRHVLADGTASAPLEFTTGSLPANVVLPSFTEQQSPPSDSELNQGMVFHVGIGYPSADIQTLATDPAGNVVWYYDSVANNFPSYATNVVPGGTVLLMGGQNLGPAEESDIREIDLAGDTLRDTNVNAVNAELAAMGDSPITSFSHDVTRLPNGDTAVLATHTKTVDLNGTPTKYVGNMVLVLDQNFQVKWAWNAFNWLNTNRLPTLGEGPGDWLHANSVSWSPEDGNLIVSLRAQDWVIKIDYANGTGDGHLIWTLGQGGSFTLNAPSSVQSPWFSHQHDVVYVNDTTIVLFDDGNGRRATDPTADSRGQELVLNEQTMTATLVVNADMGNYSQALGGAQRLPDGELVFTSGYQLSTTGAFGQTIGVLPDGTVSYELEMAGGFEYRSYFLSNLYGDLTSLIDPGFEDPPQGSGSSAYKQDPKGSAWTFSGGAGVAGPDSDVTKYNPETPVGSQVASLENAGTISQAVTFPVAGGYQISLIAAQRAHNGLPDEEVQVVIDGQVVDSFTPTSTSYSTYTTAPFDVTAGNHTITLVGIKPTSANSTALIDQIGIEDVSPTTSDPGVVNLSSAYNRTGIVADGTTFGGGGLDNDGYAFSASLVGPTLTVGATAFDLGPAGTNDAVSAAGQVIALPAGSAGTLSLLAMAVNGSQPNQSFVVTYTDGTTKTFVQSISDWAFPQGYAGEMVALSTAYRDTSSGSQQSVNVRMYEYNFALDPTKTVQSITLPKDANVEVLAATLVPAAPPQVNLSSAFNLTGIAIDGSPFHGGGLDGHNNVFSSSLVGPTLSVGSTTFDLGPSGADDVVSSAGQVIALPKGKDGSLKLLATAVDGSQPNQTFVVTYTDGTTATSLQSISDWAKPQGYAGETVALSTAYRDTSSGSQQSINVRMYEYNFALDPTKTVQSITLPRNADVDVLAIDVTP